MIVILDIIKNCLESICDIFRLSHEGMHEDNIVKAAEAFNNQFKIKHWVVHYEVSIDILWNFLTFFDKV